MSKGVPRLLTSTAVALLLLSGVTIRAQELNIPFRFQENRGHDAQYIGWAAGYRAEMNSSEITLKGIGEPIHMRFGGGRPDARIEALHEIAARTDIFEAATGEFRRDIRNYGQLLYHDVYPNVDVLFRGTERMLEFDLILKPQATPESIVLNFSGHKDLRIAADGSLVLTTSSGEMHLLPPMVYQGTSQNRTLVGTRYVKTGAQQIRFDIDVYDRTQALVIDPQVVFATYAGGSGFETAQQVALGPNGDVYVLYNVRRDSDFTQPHMWVIRFDSTGLATRYYATQFPASESGFAMAVDNQGNVALIASMSSFPDVVAWHPSPNAFQTQSGGAQDLELVKFGSNGFGSYLGGSGNDVGTALAFDPQGNLYVTGSTTSVNFPVVNAYQSTPAGASDAFLTKIDPTGSRILYSTYLGGGGNDVASSLGLDATGYMYLAGATASNNFPTAHALQSTYGGGTCTDSSFGESTSVPCHDMFVTKLNPSGSALTYSTYIGGNSEDSVYQMSVTPDGDVFIRGLGGLDFPSSSAVFSSGSNILRLDKSGSSLVYSLRFPSAGMAADAAGNVYIAGTATAGYGHPLLNSFKPAAAGTDIAVSKLDGSGALVYSTLIGGSRYFYGNSPSFVASDVSEGIAVSGDGRAYVVGETNASDFPVTNSSTLSPSNVTSDHDSVVFALAPTSGGDTAPRYSRIEENYPQVKYSGTWLVNAPAQTAHSMGRAVLAIDPGASFTMNFTGTEVHWFGCKDEWAGIASITLDGTSLGDIDTYMTPGRCGVEIWSKTGLGAGPHTLKVAVAGKRNAASASNWIWLDKLELVSSGDAGFDAGFSGPTNGGGSSGGNNTAAFTRVEQTSSAVSYYGSWFTINSGSLSGGNAAEGLNAGDRVTFTFTGTAARWIGYKDQWSGIANVYVDGAFQTQVDTYSASDVAQALLYTTPTLTSGTHTLTVEATYTRNAAASSRWIWVDAFEWTANVTGSGSSGSSSLTRTEQDSPSVSYTGGWYPINSGSLSGGRAVQALDAGARATFTFSGTVARWIGHKDPWSGIANVYVDGIFQTKVDTYSANDVAQAVIYTTPTLSAGTHTLTVEATYTRNAAASSRWIWVDAFEAASAGSGSSGGSSGGGGATPGTLTRVEQRTSAVKYTGGWYDINNGVLSSGSAVEAMDAGARANFAFTGTAAKWIGYKDPWSGIAKVYVDGVYQATVDTYSSSDVKQVVLFTTPTLASGTHVLTIEVTGTRNPSAKGLWVWVDAFEFAP